MKIAFIASHSQRNEFLQYYKRMIAVIEKKADKVYTGSLFNDKNDLTDDSESRRKWYKSAIENIKTSDLVVVEISYPSTANVGHELTYALDMGKPVVALYLEGRDPAFLHGIVNEKLILEPYTSNELETVLEDSMDYASNQQDTRFNFFISPRHQYYMDWVSKNKKIPRAVFLRRLIEHEMENDLEYGK